jgi:hypothetical protein
LFGKIFDRAKDIAFAAIFAGLVAIAGVIALAAAAAAWLAPQLGWPAALAVTGVGFLALAAIVLWAGTLPKKKKPEPEPEADEIDPVQMVLGLMELPVEVTKKIISEKPVASMVVLASLGLLIARNPNAALKMFDKLVGSFAGVGDKPNGEK